MIIDNIFALEKEFQKGIDHFNDEKFFEAHEFWENVWNSVTDHNKDFVQSIIKAAAHYVKLESKEYSPARRLATASIEQFHSIKNQSFKYRFLKSFDFSLLEVAMEYNLIKIRGLLGDEDRMAADTIRLIQSGMSGQSRLESLQKAEGMKKEIKSLPLQTFLIPKLIF